MAEIAFLVSEPPGEVDVALHFRSDQDEEQDGCLSIYSICHQFLTGKAGSALDFISMSSNAEKIGKRKI